MVEVSYDKEYDILYIYKKEKVKHSLEILGNFVVDIGLSGKVVGVEIFEASKMLKIPKSNLSKLDSVKLSSFVKDGMMAVILGIKLRNQEIESRIMVPAEARV